MTILTLPMVLGYLSMGITLSQASVATGQRCFLASGALCLIFRPIPNGGLTPMVTHRWFCYNDLDPYLGPLLGQSHQWGVLRDHTMDQLHDGLESNGIEVWIEISNNSIAGCSCIGCFRSSDGWIPIGTVTERRSGGTNHADTVGLDGRVPVNATHNL
jgi:hypothetical protein